MLDLASCADLLWAQFFRERNRNRVDGRLSRAVHPPVPTASGQMELMLITLPLRTEQLDGFLRGKEQPRTLRSNCLWK